MPTHHAVCKFLLTQTDGKSPMAIGNRAVHFTSSFETSHPLQLFILRKPIVKLLRSLE